VGVLEDADEMLGVPPSKMAKCLLEVLARLPLAHSVAWLSVVLFAATTAGTNKVLKVVVQAWLLYSFSKYVVTGIASLYGLRLLRKNDATPAIFWREDAEKSRIKYSEVVHIVAIPNYKEPIATLRRTVSTLARQIDAATSLVVVFAMEARDPKALETANSLIKEFGYMFRDAYATIHELKKGEVGGKSSNENWAVRCAKKQLVDKEGISRRRIVVTVCDADTYFHPSYFAALTHAYCRCDPNLRDKRFWQGCTQFYPNSDEVPWLCSVRYALLSVGFLGQLANPLHYRLPFAVYSLSLDLVLRAKYWDPAVIPEDWHMYLRCFYATGGRARVSPLFFPIGCECVTHSNYFKTIQACYAQATRWQWGAIDIGFIVVHACDLSGLYGLFRQVQVLLAASEHHLYYPLMWIVICAAPWLMPEYATGWRFQLWVSFYLSNFLFLNFLDASYRRILSACSRQKKQSYSLLRDTEDQGDDSKEERRSSLSDQSAGGPHAEELSHFSARRCLAFVAFPIADLLLFVLPSLHAHLRMAASTTFDYVVAPKLAIQYPQKKATQSTNYGGTDDDNKFSLAPQKTMKNGHVANKV